MFQTKRNKDFEKRKEKIIQIVDGAIDDFLNEMVDYYSDKKVPPIAVHVSIKIEHDYG